MVNEWWTSEISTVILIIGRDLKPPQYKIYPYGQDDN